jgi:nitrate/TMAO reductase-like tetraheme cytochrome c subunit
MPSPNKPEKKSLLGRLRSGIRYYPILLIVLALGIGGLVAVPVADVTDQYFSSNKFCAYGCHVMEATVYKEYKESTHYNTRTGVRPGCADCHISKGLTAAMWDHVKGTKDIYALVIKGIDTPEKYEAERAAAAERVRLQFVANDSKHCRSCHVMDAIKPERKRGQSQHAEAIKSGTTCIACHYNIVHKEVEPSEAFLKAIDSQ